MLCITAPPRGALLLLQMTLLRLSDTTALSPSTPEVHRATVFSISCRTNTMSNHLKLMENNLAQPKCALSVYVTSGAKHILVKTVLLSISWYSKFHSPTLQWTYNWVWIWFKKIKLPRPTRSTEYIGRCTLCCFQPGFHHTRGFLLGSVKYHHWQL